jgi:hypothetical protein
MESVLRLEELIAWLVLLKVMDAVGKGLKAIRMGRGVSCWDEMVFD